MGAFKGWQSTKRNPLFAKFPNVSFPEFVLNYMLTSFPGATLAFSVRLLNSGYAGYCLRVRRSTDNVTQDIGFIGLNLDTASLLTFIGGASGFVDIWYDQSGSGNNAVQIIAASQPRIVNAGVLETSWGRPALKFDGVNDYFLLTNTVSNGAPFTTTLVQQRTATSVLGCPFPSSETAGNPGSYGNYVYSDSILYGLSSAVSVVGSALAETKTITQTIISAGQSLLYRNGANAYVSQTGLTATFPFTQFGKRSTEYASAHVSEAIFWPFIVSNIFPTAFRNEISYFNN